MTIDHRAQGRRIALLCHDLQHGFKPRQGIGPQHFGALRLKRMNRCINMV
jgi:hypothetical protein